MFGILSNLTIRARPVPFLMTIIVVVLAATFTDCRSKEALNKEKDDIVKTIRNIATFAPQSYQADRLRGGNGSYVGCQFPDSLLSSLLANENATYKIQVVSRDTLRITGRSKHDTRNSVSATCDSSGTLFGWTYTADFM